MRELITCWQHTRMLVLMALCAALYVAILLPFKIAVIVPGITEIRPAAAVPVLFSIFFGPAAAWGAAFGNVIGDVLGGMIGPGSLFGFFGNFMYGFVPYRVLRIYSPERDRWRTARGWMTLVFGILIGSALCALIIALGVELLGFPYDVVVHTIFLNNTIVSIILVPLLMKALASRISQMRLTYDQILGERDIGRSLAGYAAPIIIAALIVLVYVLRMNPTWITAAAPGGAAFNIAACALLFIVTLLLL